MSVEIPNKFFFKIGEVAAITGIKPHVLRYWESEFRFFSPQKTSSRQRKYQKKDIELVLQLKDLLYNQGFTIAGARKMLAGRYAADESKTSMTDRQRLEALRQELLTLRERLRP